MTQEESVKVWLDGAYDALDTSQKLFDVGKYHHALFFLHLALEKILKCVYVSAKNDAPPYIHSLKQISQLIGLKLSEKELEQLDEISEFNVSARYEEYKYKIYKRATKEYTKIWMLIGKNFYEEFKKKI